MDPTTVLIATLGLIIIYAKVIPWIRSTIIVRRMFSKIPGPGYPIIGLTYTAFNWKIEDLLSILRELSMRYNGICAFWVVTEAFIVVSSPKYVKAILRDTVNIDKMRIYKYLTPLMGYGLVTSTGEKWHRDRKMLNPTFHFRMLEQFLPIMWKNANIMVEDIGRCVKGKPGKTVEMFDWSLQCALSIICETSMGVSVHSHVEGGRNLLEAVNIISPMILHRFFRPWLDPDWIFYRTSLGEEYKRCTDTMLRFVMQVIEKRIELRKLQKDSLENQKEDNDTGASKSKALLDYLLDIYDQSDRQLTTDEIREHVATFIVGGYETTGCSLCWTLFCIANHPECQQRLYEEIVDKLGASDVLPTQKMLSELEYLDRVLKESLRLFPPGPLLGRKIVVQTQIEEYLVPKDTIVLLSPYLTHRDPNIWPNPDIFDPDRFLPENAANRDPYAYIPFSGGLRNCIGQKFALLEMKVVIVEMLKKWRIECLTPMGSERAILTLIIKPANGLYFRFVKREPQPVS